MNRMLIVMGFMLLALLSTAPARAQFRLFGPSIETVNTKQLSKLIAERQETIQRFHKAGEEPPPADFIVVDVRTAEETAVSIIPGAIVLQDFEANRDTYRDLVVIPYCTVGGRSSEYSKQLVKEGFKVKNYKGSIMDWIKHELPLVTVDGEATRKVHTYDPRYRVPAGYEQVLR